MNVKNSPTVAERVEAALQALYARCAPVPLPVPEVTELDEAAWEEATRPGSLDEGSACD